MCKSFPSILIVGLVFLSASASASAATYTTNFSNTENPISEGGKWVGGQSAGGNLWGNVRTTPGVAFGSSQPTQFGDPTAILTGSWGANQTVQAVVSTTNPTGTCCHEVELRLRNTISSNSITGYEAYCSVMPDNAYCHIARWNGPNGSYCNLGGTNPSVYVRNGDVMKATITGTSTTVITLYINGSQIAQATDTGQNCSPGGSAGPFTTGNPGIGFYDNGDNNFSQLGFSTFSATDGQTGATFTTSVAPSSQTVTQGNTASYTVNVTPSGGFTGTVTLSASGQPSGSTASFSPSSIVTAGSSTLTVTTTASTPAASYPVTVTGTSGTLTQTGVGSLVVTAAAGGGSSAACDLNKDGTVNVVDVQLGVNKYLTCTSGPNVSSTAFTTQLVTGALGGSCSSTTGAHTVVLSWTTSTTPGVTYNVYRATTSGGYTTPLNSTSLSTTSFSDCTVAPGQTYYYVIRSVDGSGNQSANSSETIAVIPSL